MLTDCVRLSNVVLHEITYKHKANADLYKMRWGYSFWFLFLTKENFFGINSYARAISALFSGYCCYHKILDNVINAVLFQAVAIRKAHCMSFLHWRYYTLLVVSTSNEKF